MYINNYDFSDLVITRAERNEKNDDEIYIINSRTSNEKSPEMLTNASECLSAMGQMQVHNSRKILSAEDISFVLKRLANRYEKTDEERNETKEDMISYLNYVLSDFDDILASSNIDEIEDLMARKAVVDYLIEHISYNKNFSLDNGVGFQFGLPTKTIDKNLVGFQDEFEKSVAMFKKEGIYNASEFDIKKHQFDAENILNKYENKTHRENQNKYDRLFNPIERLKDKYYTDMLLDDNANFYRIISPDELISLIRTKGTKNFIDSNGHYTNGHYSCITTNPNYNEQAFGANGLPIRLKFKTRDSEGLYNMDLLNRIGTIKPERSIYKVHGYNYDDIDWNNVCINNGEEWMQLSRQDVDEVISTITGKL